MAGNAGRYISIASGPNAASAPRIRISRQRACAVGDGVGDGVGNGVDDGVGDGDGYSLADLADLAGLTDLTENIRPAWKPVRENATGKTSAGVIGV
jgi:hypothetical protein